MVLKFLLFSIQKKQTPVIKRFFNIEKKRVNRDFIWLKNEEFDKLEDSNIEIIDKLMDLWNKRV